MAKFREIANVDTQRLPKRELSGRDKKKLAHYRSYIRSMLNSTNGHNAALQLSRGEIKRVATVKRWLHRAAREEGVRIKARKRGELVIFERTE